jgi:hypothetical protein
MSDKGKYILWYCDSRENQMTDIGDDYGYLIHTAPDGTQ